VKKLVVLQSLSTGERFYSMTWPDGRDSTIMADGSVGYKVVAYCDTDHEAQTILFGKAFADREEVKRQKEAEERKQIEAIIPETMKLLGATDPNLTARLKVIGSFARMSGVTTAEGLAAYWRDGNYASLDL